MLKRTLCAAFAVAVLVAFSVPAFAGSHHKMRVRGTVESVDPAQKTFVVKDRDGKAIPFRVDDRSEFELEHRDKPDQDVPFTTYAPASRSRPSRENRRTSWMMWTSTGKSGSAS